MRGRAIGMTIVVAALSLSALGCRSARPTRDLSASLDSLFSDLHARGMFDGAVVVSGDGGFRWEKGFGDADAERQVAFTPSTPSDAASLAKTFTAALLVLLEREGRLHLDDPLQRFLPEFPYEEITLRHLLSHTSAIPVPGYEYFDAWLAADQVRTTETLLGILAAQKPPLVSRPGTSFEYSSFGYDLAALAAARASGKSYGELLSERLFRPAGITSAFVRPARFSDFPGVRTKGYRRTGDRLEPNEVFDLEAFHGGSNVYISAHDLDLWARFFFGGALLDERERATLLSRASVGGHPSGLTLGSWYPNADGSAFWYSGHLQGFHSELYRDTRNGWSIVYTSNSTIEPWLQKGIVRAVRNLLAGREATLIAPAVDPVDRSERPALAGEWRMPDGEAIGIETTGRLKLVRNGVAYPIFPDGRFFYAPGLDVMIGFAKGADGKLSKMYVSSSVDESWAVRAAR